MLVSHTWLKENLDDRNLVIIDTRPKIAYSYGHIQNSISLTVEQLIKINNAGAHLAPDPNDASQLLGMLGIDQNKTIVISGESMDPSAMRIAWTLQYLGHQNTKLLDIGIGMWQGLGLGVTRTQKKLTETQFVPKIQSNIRIESDELQTLIGKVTILDARTPQEYFGGHIPQSILFPFTDGLGQDGHIFDKKESLQNLFEQKQIQNDKEIVCYCMHGHRASSLFYQAKLAGFEKVRLYDGSFIDWASRRLALE